MTFEDWVKQRYGDNMPVSIDVKAAFTAGMKTGWEQAKREAQQALCEICCYNSADNPVPDECTTCNESRAIASMEYKNEH